MDSRPRRKQTEQGARAAKNKICQTEWKDDPDKLLLLKDRAANDEHPGMRRAAVQELRHGCI
jgi:hypothetical protein